MAFESDFLEMLAATVTYKAVASRSGYGTTTLGSGISLPAKITYVTKIVRGNSEENATSTATVVIPPPGYVVNGVTMPTVAMSDHMVLPDGLDRRVLDVKTPFDESGAAHHQTISLT